MGELLFRHETKHEITYSDYLAVRSRLRAVAEFDQNTNEDGLYLIRSLYFDNYNDKAYREKLYGVPKREKFRIRYYNGDSSLIKLEKKSKIYGLCNKLSTRITKEQVEKIIAGDIEFLRDSNNALFVDLYVKMKEQSMRPRVIVDYMREPYIYRTGNVRITFDTKVKSGLYSRDFFDKKLPCVNAAEPGSILMEVKYDRFLPEVISMCLQIGERPRTSFSKYEACRRFG